MFLKIFGFLALVFTVACSQVNFERSPYASCNGYDKTCVKTNQNGVEINSFDYVEAVPAPVLDVLFVIDNSQSMEPEQNEIAHHFPNFTQSLGNLDWRIAITTTDLNFNLSQNFLLPFQSQNRKYLKYGDGDADNLFSITVRVGDKGSGDEQGIAATNQVLDHNPSQFLRNEGHLAVVILSDEDERSYGGRHTDNSFKLGEKNLPESLIKNFDSKFLNKSLSVHSLIIQPNDSSCYNMQGGQSFQGYYGETYHRLTHLTQGIQGNICGRVQNGQSYGQQLASIANNVKTNLSSLNLACEPINQKIEVAISPQQNVQALLKGDKVSFSGNLDPRSQIHLKYSCYADPLYKSAQ